LQDGGDLAGGGGGEAERGFGFEGFAHAIVYSWFGPWIEGPGPVGRYA
jgi:hypothetical protein